MSYVGDGLSGVAPLFGGIIAFIFLYWVATGYNLWDIPLDINQHLQILRPSCRFFGADHISQAGNTYNDSLDRRLVRVWLEVVETTRTPAIFSRAQITTTASPTIHPRYPTANQGNRRVR